MKPLWYGTAEFADRHIKPLVKGLYKPLVITAMRPWRSWHSRPAYIGITGSAGKSTTKELLREVLRSVGPTIANSDSNNQLYSVGRTLLGLRPGTRHVVQELGVSSPGHLEPMVRLLQPTVGVVLNVGLDHRKSFRDADSIAREKSRLICELPQSGLAVLNADDARVNAMASLTRASVLRFGLHAQADVRGEVLTQGWPERLALKVTIGSSIARIDTRLLGAHHASCVLATVAVAHALGVPIEQIAAGITRTDPMRGRMSVLRLPHDITVLRDDWKAPLWSLTESLQVLRHSKAARRLVVLGTISDYAGSSRRAYRTALDASLACADLVVVAGARAQSIRRHAAGRIGKVMAFPTVKDASAFLAAELRSGDVLLLKGSNQADHLCRAVLSLAGEVGCWRQRCGRVIFCDECGQLRRPVLP
jgi:UDP-N-acetylmuramyl pentapeptide synthase